MPGTFAPFVHAAVTVDLVVFTVVDTDLKVLLITRGVPPFEGAWALPGGFVRAVESVEEAAYRELCEETGLPRRSLYLEQLFTFGDLDRDPRGRVVTVAHYALVHPDLAPVVTAGTDAARAAWWSLTELDTDALAFDHARILELAVERVRGKIDYAPIAFDLVPPTFTVSELRSVYEAIKGATYDAPNFRRRFKRMLTDGTLEVAPGKRHTGRRPATVYRFRR